MTDPEKEILVKELSEFELGTRAKKLAILIGYRTTIARSVRESTGKKKKANLARLNEANSEMKKLLKIY